VIRAVENGFTLFRCVSQGVSGIFEPTLDSLYTQKVASVNNDQYLFYLPIQKRVATVYSYIGNIFVYICLSLGTFIFAFISNTVRKNRKIAI
jgi:apolipoprotein N-acyltransferase